MVGFGLFVGLVLFDLFDVLWVRFGLVGFVYGCLFVFSFHVFICVLQCCGFVWVMFCLIDLGCGGLGFFGWWLCGVVVWVWWFTL